VKLGYRENSLPIENSKDKFKYNSNLAKKQTMYCYRPTDVVAPSTATYTYKFHTNSRWYLWESWHKIAQTPISKMKEKKENN